MRASDFVEEVGKYADVVIAEHSKRFFKTGEGQYGEGDEFIGVRVPQLRKICKIFKNLPLGEVQKLLDSKIHEHRLAAVIILSGQFTKSDQAKKRQIYEMYLKNVAGYRINNWDIIDVSAPRIVGAYLHTSDRKILYKLSRSDNLWEKRAAIISTLFFIKKGEYKDTLKLTEILLKDNHDLIHKACGWMLREVGNMPDGKPLLLDFLDQHVKQMPRTMLRYAIEKLPEDKRLYYLRLK